MDSNILNKMFEGVDRRYSEILVVKNRTAFSKCIKDVNSAVKNDVSKISPTPDNILRAFKLCPWDELKVLIIGQDPYPKPGDADGMAFSSHAKTTPASLKNIFKCLKKSGLIKKKPEHSRLDTWARQGVLMLNSALTTEAGKVKAHFKIWDAYTDAVVKGIVEAHPNIILLLWGNDAKSKASVVEHDKVLTWGHPSPVSTVNRSKTDPKSFRFCDNFRRCNEMLTAMGKTPINWDSINEDAEAIENVKAAPDANILYIGTDGGSRGNGKKDCRASWAYFCLDGNIVYNGSGLVPSTPDCPATNNRGELTGIIKALEHIDKLDANDRRDVLLLSDSEYSINTLTKFAPNWFKDPVKHEIEKKKNIDLVKQGVDLIAKIRLRRKLTFEHVNSHEEEPTKGTMDWHKWYINDQCDQMCNKALDG
jgi:uracil-DNA glycosylase